MSNEELDQNIEHEEMQENLDDQVQDMQQEDMEVEDQGQGYQTYEEYVSNGGDPENFKGPKAYNDFGKLLKQIEELKKEVRLKDHTTSTVLNEFQNIRLREREKIYEDLYNQRAAAIDEGDHETVDQLTNQMYQVAQEHQQSQQKHIQDEIKNYENKFINNHPEWFGGKDYNEIQQTPEYLQATQYTQQLSAQMRMQGYNPIQYLDQILQQVEKMMSNKTNNNMESGAGQPQQQQQQPKVNMNSSQSNINKGAHTNSRLNLTAKQKAELVEINKMHKSLGIPEMSTEQAKEYFKKHKIK